MTERAPRSFREDVWEREARWREQDDLDDDDRDVVRARAAESAYQPEPAWLNESAYDPSFPSQSEQIQSPESAW